MKPSLPKGTRDFGPNQVLKREYIFDIIKDSFKLYGFAPLETPAMESLSTLTGKYGEEGDRLLFKILNNGDFLNGANEEALEAKNSQALISSISKRGLRYDLTVPFARYVAMNQNNIAFPFKRYQIQPVWRADRPQRGRYQEFYQCDADIIGSNHLMYESELIQIYDRVFSRLNLPVVIRINNRKILYGIAEKAEITDKFVQMTTALDKLDKIGWEGVSKEMSEQGISSEQIALIKNVTSIEDLAALANVLSGCPVGTIGCQEVLLVFDYIKSYPLTNSLKFDMSLARGLNYYTGCILEVNALNTNMGSIGGGGRYDDLTGVFDMPGMSGVGVSFGAERIYDVLEEKGLFPENLDLSVQVLIVSFNNECFKAGMKLVGDLRNAGIASDLYPGAVKMQKQMKYANDRNIPYVIIIGSDELQENLFTLKNMVSGHQEKLRFEDILAKF
jgi:histidyl-tRNA synthetase